MNHFDRLKQALRACEGYGNDHDFICSCRPVDVRWAVTVLTDIIERGNQYDTPHGAMIMIPRAVWLKAAK